MLHLISKFRDMGTTWDSFSYSVASGALVDLSFSGDGIAVSKKMMAALYGEGDDVTPESVLDGHAPPPEGMAPLYDKLEGVMAAYWESYKVKKARDAGIDVGGPTPAATAAAAREASTQSLSEEPVVVTEAEAAEPAEPAEAREASTQSLHLNRSSSFPPLPKGAEPASESAGERAKESAGERANDWETF